MGADAGFDMVPRLSKGAADKQNWQSFINVIKEQYQNDDLVEITPLYITFKAREHPLLPFERHEFLRFSSKISGSHAKGVENYIRAVTQAARAYFGPRVQYWNAKGDKSNFYNWPEVHDSCRSYLEVCYDILNLTFEGV